MRKYIVAVTRICYQTMDIEVDAEDAKEAKKKAVDEASNRDFSGLEKDAAYEANSVILTGVVDRR